MDQLQKDQLRNSAQSHVNTVRIHLKQEVDATLSDIDRLEQIIKGAVKGSQDEESTDIEKTLVYDKKNRLSELEKLDDSPYFNKCSLQFAHEEKPRTIFFGKFPYAGESITSWTTPLARLRFEAPGSFNIIGENQRLIQGTLLSKDQYMISKGHIVFMATEAINNPRELVHQERLMRKKTEFTLPEIVEQMEKAQDDVIRAHWKGSFLIAGPAGSGKTTLALHRVAYLAQAPETEGIFPTHKILVLVQDTSTKKYFSGLLPELGINKVNIATFEEWLLQLLHLEKLTFQAHILEDETESDAYELAKFSALSKLKKLRYKDKDWQDILIESYENYLSKEQMKILMDQFLEQKIDRFDITVLAKHKIFEEGNLHHYVTKYQLIKGMHYKKSKVKEKVEYSLIIVDEAENYLAEQISILKSCISKKTQAMLYVGDLAQQTKTHTIKDWTAVSESFEEGRKVTLHKVYRNTKQILEYIQTKGFNTTIPAGVREGFKVSEIYCETKDHELRKSIELINDRNEGLIGVLAKNEQYLELFKQSFYEHPNVLVMTINEAQGVEFDTVILVGARPDIFQLHHPNIERARVDHDLFYVALTRAMNELFILGNKLEQLSTE